MDPYTRAPQPPGLTSPHQATTNGHGDNSTNSNIARQMEVFRESDRQRDQLMTNLVDMYQKLYDEFQTKCEDVAAADISRRAYQQEVAKLRGQLNSAQGEMSSNNFVVAVIDGDGAVFIEDLLAAGASGGSDAAHRLHTEIKSYLQRTYENYRQWSIVVNIFVNMDGLGRKLASVGQIDHPELLRTFARAFSLNQPLFNIIDVGEGKERADHKVKELFRLYIYNVHCRHVIFGPCADTGYLNLLDSFKHDQAVSGKITLLQTTSAHPGFRALKFDITTFPTVFRSDPLPSGLPLLNPIQAPAPIPSLHQTPQPLSLANPRTHSGSQHQHPGPIQPPPPSTASPIQRTQSIASTISTMSPVEAPKETQAQSPPVPVSYAAAGKTTPQIKSIPIHPSPAPKDRKFVIINNEEYRLDRPLGRIDRETMLKLNERSRNGKLCNTFHIKGKCDNPMCKYKHEPRLGGKDLLALRFKARSLKCSEEGWCRDADCYLGHVCQSQLLNNGHCQYNGSCHFEDMHEIDLTPASRVFEDGTIQEIQAS